MCCGSALHIDAAQLATIASTVLPTAQIRIAAERPHSVMTGRAQPTPSSLLMCVHLKCLNTDMCAQP